MTSPASTNEPAVDPALVTAVEDLFGRASGHEQVARAELEGLPQAMWDAASELGFPFVGIDEKDGGSGGTLLDLLAILRVAGRHAVPLPLAETHLAAWLLAAAGLHPPSPGACLTVAPGSEHDVVELDDDVATGVLHGVPWGASAHRVVAFDSSGQRVLALDPARCDVHAGRDLAGQPRDRLTFTAVPVEAAQTPYSPQDLMLRGALLRAAQLSGAMQMAYELTTRFTREREQFGRPIATFQAVQQHLVTLAQAAAMTALSVDRAGQAATHREAAFEIWATKLVSNEQATVTVRAAHQAHGAIGMTQEYRLQQLTRRLNTWRADFGTTRELEKQLAERACTATSLARLITDESRPGA